MERERELTPWRAGAASTPAPEAQTRLSAPGCLCHPPPPGPPPARPPGPSLRPRPPTSRPAPPPFPRSPTPRPSRAPPPARRHGVTPRAGCARARRRGRRVRRHPPPPVPGLLPGGGAGAAGRRPGALAVGSGPGQAGTGCVAGAAGRGGGPVPKSGWGPVTRHLGVGTSLGRATLASMPPSIVGSTPPRGC